MFVASHSLPAALTFHAVGYRVTIAHGMSHSRATPATSNAGSHAKTHASATHPTARYGAPGWLAWKHGIKQNNDAGTKRPNHRPIVAEFDQVRFIAVMPAQNNIIVPAPAQIDARQLNGQRSRLEQHERSETKNQNEFTRAYL